MVPGIGGTDEIASVLAAPVPHEFTARTLKVPEENPFPKFNLTVAVPCPFTMVVFDGAVQV